MFGSDCLKSRETAQTQHFFFVTQQQKFMLTSIFGFVKKSFVSETPEFIIENSPDILDKYNNENLKVASTFSTDFIVRNAQGTVIIQESKKQPMKDLALRENMYDNTSVYYCAPYALKIKHMANTSDSLKLTATIRYTLINANQDTKQFTKSVNIPQNSDREVAITVFPITEDGKSSKSGFHEIDALKDYAGLDIGSKLRVIDEILPSSKLPDSEIASAMHKLLRKDIRLMFFVRVRNNVKSHLEKKQKLSTLNGDFEVRAKMNDHGHYYVHRDAYAAACSYIEQRFLKHVWYLVPETFEVEINYTPVPNNTSIAAGGVQSNNNKQQRIDEDNNNGSTQQNNASPTKPPENLKPLNMPILSQDSQNDSNIITTTANSMVESTVFIQFDFQYVKVKKSQKDELVDFSLVQMLPSSGNKK